MNAGPLSGIRVVDFTWVGAGAFLTKPLADHGADVIKIESETRTDPIRWMEPFRDGIRGIDRSGYFANRNSSKRSVTLDLKHPEGRDFALRLIAVSDVVANNFAAGIMDKLGLGYDAAKAVRPEVVYLEMPMQGNTGPHRNFRGYGLTIGAISGFLATSGWPDRTPVGTGTNFPDHAPNPLHAAIAVLAALRARRITGRGQYIEMSQLESTINVIAPAVIGEALTGERFHRRGNLDRRRAPHGVYPCAGDDRWIAIAVEDDAQWAAVRTALGGLPALGAEFDAHEYRLANTDALDFGIAAATAPRDATELAAGLSASGVAAALVKDARDLMADPQLESRGHWVTLDHPEMGPSLYDAPPYRLSRTPGGLRSPAPLLGADGHEVATEILGVTDEEYERLHSEGIIG